MLLTQGTKRIDFNENMQLEKHGTLGSLEVIPIKPGSIEASAPFTITSHVSSTLQALLPGVVRVSSPQFLPFP